MSDLRTPTPAEQEVIASVARMTDRLRAAKFEPKCVILNDKAWGTETDCFTVILGLPVIHRPDKDWPPVEIGVLAP